MRHQTHAYRVGYGVSTFITFSPSERDSALMVRLVRARGSDPAIAFDDGKTFYGREKPELTVEFFRLSPERLAEVLRVWGVCESRRGCLFNAIIHTPLRLNNISVTQVASHTPGVAGL